MKPTRKWPTATDDLEREILEHVRRWDWFLALGAADDDGPAFGYTIGLTESFAHPELLVVGVDIYAVRGGLEKLAERVKAGARFAHGDRLGRAIGSREGMFLRVAPDRLEQWVSSAQWFYDRDDIDVLQIACAANSGKWPWEDVTLAIKQPMLGVVPSLAPSRKTLAKAALPKK